MGSGFPALTGSTPVAATTAPTGATNSGWVGAIVPAQPGAKPADLNLAEGVMRYLVLDPPQPTYDFMTFDFDRDTRLMERWARLANATDPDLSAFRKSGGESLVRTQALKAMQLSQERANDAYDDILQQALLRIRSHDLAGDITDDCSSNKIYDEVHLFFSF